jgi:hypothetical protein
MQRRKFIQASLDLDAQAVFSKEINLVNERLNSTDNYLEMVHIVEDFLYYLVRQIK